MSVGETLAEARSRAGLSVDDLSERTKIRGTVIQCIEQDDYDACGGDVFVRGYVRALAGAVGIDAQPLIREYDKARTDTSGDTFAHVARIARPVPPSDPAVTAADIPAAEVPPAAADSDSTAADLPAVSPDPVVTAYDLPVVSEDPTPTVADLPVIPAEPFEPSEPAGPPGLPVPPLPSAPPPPPAARRGDLPGNWTPVPPGTRSTRGGRHDGRRDRRRVARIAVPALLVLAAAGVAGGLALSSQPAPAGKNAAAVTQPSTHAAHAPLASTPATSAAPTPTPSATTQAPPQPAAIRALHIASADAFGPGGLADGDNERIASYAISRGAPAPWQSQWYATAHFGALKQGTGLLLDLGRAATVTSVRVDLAAYRGANLQLRTSNTAGALSSLRVAAVTDDVGGTVRLYLRAPAHARYVLIWFTMLPPNGDGQYQASIYHVVVNGRP